MTTRRSSHFQPGWYMPYAVSATNPKPINRSSSSTAVHARIYHTWYGTYARMYSVCSIPGTRYHGTRQDACKNKINKMLEEYTDAPSIRDTPSILGAYAILRVYSEYRVFFVLRVPRGLEYWRPKYSEHLSMSSTDGPNTASTGSMRSTYARVQAVTAVQKLKILGVLRVSRVLNPEILQHSSKILRVIL